MWPFPSPKRPKPEPTPRWVLWGLLIFLTVIMYINSKSESPDQPSVLKQSIENVKSELPKPEDYTKLLPNETKVEHKIIEPGSKAPFMCGQQLTLQVQAYADGAASGGAKTHVVKLGDKDVPPFIAQALKQGVGVGSKQEFIFSEKQKLSSINPGALLESLVDKVELQVVEAKPDLGAAFEGSGLNIQLFDADVKPGAPAACGDSVKLAITLWDAEGKQIFSNPKTEDAVTIHIGANRAMLGIEQGVIGMTLGSARTIILPPVWQHVADPVSATPEIPAILRKPHKQMLVASVLRVE